MTRRRNLPRLTSAINSRNIRDMNATENNQGNAPDGSEVSAVLADAIRNARAIDAELEIERARLRGAALLAQREAEMVRTVAAK
jgi:hypothetical protein